jgi:hypothetical protein
VSVSRWLTPPESRHLASSAYFYNSEADKFFQDFHSLRL